MDSKEYFEKVADRWDRMQQSFFSENVRKAAVARAQVRPGELAADIGAGTGFMTEELIKNELRVIAVDRSGSMIEEMKKKFSRYDEIEYRIGDFNNLPLQNETVDYVFANMYLHHVEIPQLAIDEVVRILRPAGKVVITEMDEHDFEFLVKEQHDRWMGFKRGDIALWFERAGLRNVSVDCLQEDCCADSVECGQRASVGIFVAYGEKV